LRTYCDCTSSQEDQTATTEATGDVDEAGAATDSAIETAAAEQDQVTEEPEKVEAETDAKSAAVSAETSAPEQQPEAEMPAAPDGRRLWIGTGKSDESKPRKCTGPTGSSLGGEDGRGRKRRER